MCLVSLHEACHTENVADQDANFAGLPAEKGCSGASQRTCEKLRNLFRE